MIPSLQDWAAPRRSQIDSALAEIFSETWPPEFGAMCSYPLSTGGKRMRPLLVLAAYESVAKEPLNLSPALPAALSIELIHTYSLVHDDLPCMDDDSERRGHPTVHLKYGEGPAVLVGDALLTAAFGVVARSMDLSAEQRSLTIEALARAAGHLGMIGGQAADLGLGGPVGDVETLLRLHALKTGALMHASCEMGAIAGQSTPEERAALETFGQAMGLAFQLTDDLLDLEEDTGENGPPSFPALVGIEETKHTAAELRDTALSCLESLSGPVTPLADLARFTLERTS